MDEKPAKLKLPENLYNDMLMFFRRTSLPRIQRQMHEEKLKQKAQTESTPSGNKSR